MFIIWHQDEAGRGKLYTSEGPLRLGQQGRRLYKCNTLESITIPGVHGDHLDTGTVLIQACGTEEKQLVSKFKLIGVHNIPADEVDRI